MPEISRFLGIVVKMYYDDHAPPHFHAVYGDYRIEVFFDSGVVQGRFPKRALRLVLEWMDQHRRSLREDWELAAKGQPLKEIPPLE